MTIKQQGGVFGRNPTFNNLTVEGALTTSGTVSLPADSISGDAINGGTATPDTVNATDGTFSTLTATTSADLELLTVDVLELNGATVGWTNSGSVTTSLFTSGAKEQSLILRLDDNDASATGYFEVQEGSAGSKLLTVKEDNDVIFYKTDGSTAGMTYDASAFSLAFASGGGIDFSATSGTGTSELFDDYEEGTWSPTQGSGVTVTGSFSSSGKYTKVGRLVTVVGEMSGSTNISVSGVGQLFPASDLPYTLTSANTSVGSISTGAANVSNTIVAGYISIFCTQAISSTAAALHFAFSYHTA